MACIVKQKSGNTTYLYESTSYRQSGKVKSRRKIVGKIDPTTGRAIFHQDYLARMEANGTPIVPSDDEPRFSVNDIKSATFKEFGLTGLLQKLASKSGLNDALNVAIPSHSDEILTLAEHLVSTGDPFMYTQDWLENVEAMESVGNLSSQKISKIISDVSFSESERFYGEWARKRSETEFLALDITSTSSYSELIGDVEWGYNRDGEDLAQINLCMLTGEDSRLPVYQTSYSGSLKDVSTLDATLDKFASIADRQQIVIVTDKGFYSQKNVDTLLQKNRKFVIAVPFSSNFADKQVDEFSEKINSFDNLIIAGKDKLRGTTVRRKLGNKFVFAHVFYNPVKAVNSRENLYAKVDEMRNRALSEPEKYADSREFTRFFEFSKTQSGWKVLVKKDAVERAYKHAGWLIIISNHVKNATTALRIYRAKDVVEKGFLRLKNSLDIGRLRVHSDEAVRCKLLIGFIALILMSVIHNVMVDCDLYKKWTMKEVLAILSKRRVCKIGDIRIEMPETKDMREIVSAFGT